MGYTEEVNISEDIMQEFNIIKKNKNINNIKKIKQLSLSKSGIRYSLSFYVDTAVIRIKIQHNLGHMKY